MYVCDSTESSMLPAMNAAGESAPEAALTLLQPLLARLDILAKEANFLGVHILVDAEQTYFQVGPLTTPVLFSLVIY